VTSDETEEGNLRTYFGQLRKLKVKTEKKISQSKQKSKAKRMR